MLEDHHVSHDPNKVRPGARSIGAQTEQALHVLRRREIRAVVREEAKKRTTIRFK